MIEYVSNKQRSPLIQLMVDIYQSTLIVSKKRLCCSETQSLIDLYLDSIYLSANLIPKHIHRLSDDEDDVGTGTFSLDIIDRILPSALEGAGGNMQLLEKCGSVMYIRTEELNVKGKFN